ncbi:MAG: amino acid ABC transporter substrate-binding protein [Sulfurimonas sp.]|nr:amino acid ABC transporter substrate-binding protein [Sulfurimonas sp.]MBU1217049.1 transporter substrate-binding domain-containing protein [bacterium]MBU1435392.1 transporter substrate-binding domain-containing protein [bacterium]MBU1502297.1 transporter substrate-binding domain-containing protein [bacterium]MBU3940237.1 transporter substrate-binding domain-containing protein [bacterium]
MKNIIIKPTKLLVLLMFFLSVPLTATGPRVSSNILSLEKNEVFALDLPPFISTEADKNGALSEIVNAVFAEEKIENSISIIPLQSMIKYYLTQDTTLAVMGRHLGISKEDNKSLMEIPLYLSNEYYLYYKPLHAKNLEFNGKLSNLKGLRYGASSGEETAAYENAQIKVENGRTLSLFKKLKKGTVDFISMPTQSAQWILKKNFAHESKDFVMMQGGSGSVFISIYFNLKHPEGKTLAGSFKKGLQSIVTNGKYASILEKHLKNPDDVKLQLEQINKFLK